MRIGLVMNRKAGSVLGRSSRDTLEQIRAALAGLGPVVASEAVSGSALAAHLQRMAGRPDIDTLVVAGGDGTVSLAARHAIAAGKRLMPVPLGTFNLFSRTLGWGGDGAGALDLIERAESATVDAGIVNATPFVHHVSCGLHPRFVRLRDALSFGSRTGKVAAAAWALVRTVRTTPHRRVWIELDGETVERRTLGLAITVNRLAETIGIPPIPDDPAGGQLAVYIAGGETMAARLALVASAVRGRWGHNRRIEARAVRSLRLTNGRPRIPVSVDGELRYLDAPLDISIRPHALKVVRVRRD